MVVEPGQAVRNPLGCGTCGRVGEAVLIMIQPDEEPRGCFP